MTGLKAEGLKRMRVFGQPARRSDRVVDRHFLDTIARPVEFSEHGDLLGVETMRELTRIFPGGTAQIWGVMPGKGGANLPEIRKMAPGDWVFFSGDKRLYFGGRVALSWQNRGLAARLWGTGSDGDSTWEFMYALAGTREFNVPMEEIRSLLGWKESRNIMRFQAFTESESDLLRERFALDSPPSAPLSGSQALPGLHSDSASSQDLLSIGPDVEMLAKLAVATTTTPPLAIALLGEWGAGKSSFMEQMSRQVEQLAELSAASADGGSAFASNVRQIHFNAWHYSDDHVWSGLVDRIFQALASPPETPSSNVSAVAPEQYRKYSDELAGLEARQQRLGAQLSRTDRDREEGFLSFLNSPLDDFRLLLTATRLAVEDVRLNWLVLVGWALTGAGALAAYESSRVWLAQLVGTLGLVASPALLFLSVLRHWHVEEAGFIGGVRERLERRQNKIQGRVILARARLAEVDAAMRLSSFLSERGSSDTYKQYRGLLGTVHRDLSELDEKLRAARTEWSRAQSAASSPLERIILYIDDLDRCPPARVVEVLAAIHLMLALPLFVVVVAVDPRWLLRSLELHYSELFRHTEGGRSVVDPDDAATPLDYLDKIFQIPFAVPPADADRTAGFISALLASSAAPPPAADVAPEARTAPAPSNEPDAAARIVEPVLVEEPGEEVVLSSPEFNLNPEQLRLQTVEIEFMSRLSPLTRTPRAAKKLVNLYRLVRIDVGEEELPAFIGGQSGNPGVHQAVQILLAVLVGRPRHAQALFEYIYSAPPTAKISTILRDSSAGDASGTFLADLIEQIHAEIPMVMEVGAYQQWCPKLARFSFYTRGFVG